eukprot:scaffold5222_cov106-Isochrysis_galbana.AAC.2
MRRWRSSVTVVAGVGASTTDQRSGCVGDESSMASARAMPASSSQSFAFKSPVSTTGTSIALCRWAKLRSSRKREPWVVATSRRTVGSLRQWSSVNRHVRSAVRDMLDPKLYPPVASSPNVRARQAMAHPSAETLRGRFRQVESNPPCASRARQKESLALPAADVVAPHGLVQPLAPILPPKVGVVVRLHRRDPLRGQHAHSPPRPPLAPLLLHAVGSRRIEALVHLLALRLGHVGAIAEPRQHVGPRVVGQHVVVQHLELLSRVPLQVGRTLRQPLQQRVLRQHSRLKCIEPPPLALDNGARHCAAKAQERDRPRHQRHALSTWRRADSATLLGSAALDCCKRIANGRDPSI